MLLAASVASVWPIVSTGDWYVSHQSYRYPYLLELFQASFLSGHLYPRWLPELYGGYGCPTFLYYPPGLWFFALPLSLTLGVLPALYVALISLFALGGAGAYRLARLTLGRWPALLCALLFLLSPYLSTQLYSRGSLSELAAMLLCPWAFFRLLRLKQALEEQRSATRPALLLAATLAAMVLTHSLMTLWLGIAFGLVLAALRLGRDWPRGFLPALLVSGAIALALTSPYWYPALALRDAASLERALWAGAPIKLREFFSLEPRCTALPCTILALAGFWLGRKQRLIQGAALAAAALVLIMLPFAAPLWQRARLLQMTQHPGRIFSVFATLELLAFIACVGALVRRPRFTPGLQAVAALLVLAASWWPVRDRYRVEERLDYARFRHERQRSFEDMTHNHEFQPRGSRIEGLLPRVQAGLPVAVAGEGATLTIQSQRDDDIVATATVAAAPATITVNQFAFPGWRLALNDRPLPSCRQSQAACWQRDEDGRMRIRLTEAGSVTLRAWFAGPPGGLARGATILLTLGLGVAWLRRLDRLRAATATRSY
jgi:hypothetical protein